MIESGRVVHDPSIVLDMLPTMLDFAGVPPPKDRVIDGRTLAPLLRGTGHREATDFYFGSGMLTACRSGRWKLQTVRAPGQQWDERPATVMLFDIEADIGETADLAEKHPDIVRQLQKQMRDAEQTMRR
jgi:arylsulfatase A-like enzyme